MRSIVLLVSFVGTTCAFAQAAPATPSMQLSHPASPSLACVASSSLSNSLPDAPQPAQQQGSAPTDTQTAPALPPPQPHRILGVMPNYRAVSAGTHPPPPSPHEAFKIATQNSFDYSAFTFVALTSLSAEASNSHPQLGKGIGGYYGYYWRGFLDKTDGNYWVIFALPTVFHEDERYYALGHGSVFKRAVYAASRILITPDYNGHNTINGAELLGRGVAQGISVAYYPSADRTVSGISTKYGYALMRDAATNVFRELWPDVSAHLSRHKS